MSDSGIESERAAGMKSERCVCARVYLCVCVRMHLMHKGKYDKEFNATLPDIKWF